ncbi:hypothetical protein [Streptomyces sp. NPDC002067]
MSDTSLPLEPGESAVLVGTLHREDGTPLYDGQATTLRLAAVPRPPLPALTAFESTLLRHLAHEKSLDSLKRAYGLSAGQVSAYATALRRRYEAPTRAALIYAAQRAGHLHTCDRARLLLTEEEVRLLRWLARGGTLRTYATARRCAYKNDVLSAYHNLLTGIHAASAEHAVHLAESWGYLSGSTQPP